MYERSAERVDMVGRSSSMSMSDGREDNEVTRGERVGLPALFDRTPTSRSTLGPPCQVTLSA